MKDDQEWPETGPGCLYELVTVGGAMLVTTVVALILWRIIGAILTALIC